jgi:hypothetical protein
MNSSTINASSSAHTNIVWQLLATEQTWAPTFARLALGSMIFAHGAQFLLGWFGGFGFAPSVKWYVENLHPIILAKRHRCLRPDILAAERKRQFQPSTGGRSTDARDTSGHSKVTGLSDDPCSFGSASVNWSTAHEPISK